MGRKRIFLIIFICIFYKNFIWACHKGGPMGFATNDPGGFSLDITLSPTYTGASTLGTLNCKNWDYAKYKKNKFLLSQWTYLSEEAAQGKGNNLTVLSRIMGCGEKKQKEFYYLLQKNFSYLFSYSKPKNDFFEKLEIILSKNSTYNCYG